MKNIKIYIIAALMMTIMLSANAEAKWWIFGQSNEEVSINYMYLNKISYDESGPAVTLYKETLTDGMIVINGKASAKSGKIGRVRVTINNKETWEKAKLSDTGAFEYRFTPDAAKTYIVFVETADTAGKTNDIEATRKEISISDQNATAAIREVLDKMIEAYKNENAAKFMSYVAEDFAGDETNLDGAIRRDFSNFDNIDLNYTLNNVASGANGIYVSLNYNLILTPTRNSNTSLVNENGITELVFKLGEEGPKVYSMKHPIIFGRSKASEIATGTVNNMANNEVIVVNPNGQVTVVSFQEAQQGNWGEESGGSFGGSPLTMTYNNIGNPLLWWFDSFCFEDETKEHEFWGNLNISGDFGVYGDSHHLLTRPDVQVKDMGVRSLDSIVTADAAGYAYSNGEDLRLADGHSYVFKLPGGAYGAIEVRGLDIPNTTFRYKYAPDGPNF